MSPLSIQTESHYQSATPACINTADRCLHLLSAEQRFCTHRMTHELKWSVKIWTSARLSFCFVLAVLYGNNVNLHMILPRRFSQVHWRSLLQQVQVHAVQYIPGKIRFIQLSHVPSEGTRASLLIFSDEERFVLAKQTGLTQGAYMSSCYFCKSHRGHSWLPFWLENEKTIVLLKTC